jgi:hypothetical protein
VSSTGSTASAELFPELGELAALADQGDWRTLELVLDAEQDAEVLIRVMNVIVERPGVERLLEDVVFRQRDSALANTLLAWRHVVLGWQARSGRRAEHVRMEDFHEFVAQLRRAERRLIDVCARYPAYVPAWHVRLPAARGLQLGTSEVRRRYDRLARLQPHCLESQRQLLQQLCPKWSGDPWDAAFEFVRGCSAEAPEASAVPSLIAEIYIELYMELGADEGSRRLAEPDVLEELRAAGQASVLNPNFPMNYLWASAHSAFALAFSLAGEHASARPHFEALGPYVAAETWERVTGDPKALLERHQALASAAARR